jgi:hypothetical protein
MCYFCSYKDGTAIADDAEPESVSIDAVCQATAFELIGRINLQSPISNMMMVNPWFFSTDAYLLASSNPIQSSSPKAKSPFPFREPQQNLSARLSLRMHPDAPSVVVSYAHGIIKKLIG